MDVSDLFGGCEGGGVEGEWVGEVRWRWVSGKRLGWRCESVGTLGRCPRTCTLMIPRSRPMINLVRKYVRQRASQLRQLDVASSIRNQAVLTSGCSGQLSSGFLHQHRLPFVVDSL